VVYICFKLFCTYIRQRCCIISFPTRRSSDLICSWAAVKDPGGQVAVTAITDDRDDDGVAYLGVEAQCRGHGTTGRHPAEDALFRSEEHTSELQSRENLVCRLLLEKQKTCHIT